MGRLCVLFVTIFGPNNTQKRSEHPQRSSKGRRPLRR